MGKNTNHVVILIRYCVLISVVIVTVTHQVQARIPRRALAFAPENHAMLCKTHRLNASSECQRIRWHVDVEQAYFAVPDKLFRLL